MALEVMAKKDLRAFRLQRLRDIRDLPVPMQMMERPWLKNVEVKKLLAISTITIQRLRISGALSSTNVGGMHFYRYEDVERILKGGKG